MNFLLAAFNTAVIANARPLLSSRVALSVAHTRRIASSPRLAISTDLQSSLDNVPLFTVGNEEGQPLQYQVGSGGAEKKVAIFFADVEAAKKQLADAQSQNPDLKSYDLVPVGLGSAYKLSCDGKAMVVPGLPELVAAGAPEDAQPMGQELPLFACMEMTRTSEDGKTVVPLFISHSDCAAAVQQAADARPDDPLEIVPLSLQGVVEQLDDPATGSFSFEAPSASISHIESYVGQGVYWREAEPAEEPEK